MGVVYAAEDTRLRRKVAIKVLPEGMTSDPERLARFEREARAIASISHPNIVTIFSVEEHAGRHCIVMELVEGSDLERLMPPAGLPLDRFFKLACQDGQPG